jgi:hypothetical protein
LRIASWRREMFSLTFLESQILRLLKPADVGVGGTVNVLHNRFVPSDTVSIDMGLVDKVMEILGSDKVHDGEESLAVMCILEKVILGHQSNRGITISD